jgi:hypothetical protein
MFNFLRLATLAIVFSIGMNSHLGSTQAAANQIYESESENIAASDRPDNGMKTIAAVAIIGTGAAVIVSSAKRGGYLPQFSVENSHQVKQGDPQLQRKLLKLLHNDPNTANRLLAQIKQTHPDRSANWVIEKVIYDLERDRNRH